MRLYMMRLAFVLMALVMFSVPAWAGFAAGQAAYDRGDFATAFREWKPLAKRGDAKAQYDLGVMYANGKDVAGLLINNGLGREYHGGKRHGWCK